MAKDVFHDAVKKGLEKEGWLITDNPLRIQAGGADQKIDWIQAPGFIRGEEKCFPYFISPSIHRWGITFDF